MLGSRAFGTIARTGWRGEPALAFCALGWQFMSVPPQISGEHHEGLALPLDINQPYAIEGAARDGDDAASGDRHGMGLAVG